MEQSFKMIGLFFSYSISVVTPIVTACDLFQNRLARIHRKRSSEVNGRLFEARENIVAGPKGSISFRLHGCGFHWAQAIQRRVKEVGLQTTYQQREGVHHLIRKLLANPFMQASYIPRAFEKVSDRAEASEPLRDMFKYVVNDQSLESSVWSPQEWSVYRQTVRTNIDTEGWHRRLNAKAGRGALPLYVLLAMLLQEAKLVSISSHLIIDHSVGRSKRPTHVKMDTSIFYIWDKYDDHEIVCEEFLKEIGDIYGKISLCSVFILCIYVICYVKYYNVYMN